jgi:metal-responsive CopG/Arc/MetJ family transcriptional regulator
MIQNKTLENLSARRAATIRVAVTVRLPEDVVDKIDSELESRAIPMSRNNWLLEAAIEKLQRERRRGSNGTK